jgi:ferredoxin
MRMGAQPFQPRIHADLCTGCGACVPLCPTGALGWRDAKAALLYPQLCTYCAACEEICAPNAIELPYLVVKSAALRRGNDEQHD